MPADFIAPEVEGDVAGAATKPACQRGVLGQPGAQRPRPACQADKYALGHLGGRLTSIASPGFCLQGGRGVATLATLRQAVSGLGRYRESLAAIAGAIESTQPDLILNFLEPLMGVFNLLRPHPIPVVSVGHHFMLGHPEFVRSRQFALPRWTMRQYVRLAGALSTKLALSFYPAASMPERRLFVCPPLLRREIFDLPQDSPGRFLLAYVLNQGYAADVLRWHTVFPDVELHCFCEKPKVEPVWRYDSTLSFHKLDGAKFLRMMAESRGVACTAGFESLSEAAWLGKPLLVVPVENHVEQHLNALDLRSLATQADAAEKAAEAARKGARLAKASFKAARKAFKSARKVAKQARKDVKAAARALRMTAKTPTSSPKKPARASQPGKTAASDCASTSARARSSS